MGLRSGDPNERQEAVLGRSGEEHSRQRKHEGEGQEQAHTERI